ncbi:LPXTG cell wall anchor domain-containing protein [Mammaliicoccus sciuri]
MGMGSTDSSNNDGNKDTKATNMNNNDNKDNHHKYLPDTGEMTSINGALFGGLFAGAGSLLLLGRRKRDHKDSK